MMVKFNQVTEAELAEKPFSEGNLYFTNDTHRLYMDPIGFMDAGGRCLIGDPIFITQADFDMILAPIPEKLYVIIETGEMKYYSNQWITVNGQLATETRNGWMSYLDKIKLNRMSVANVVGSLLMYAGPTAPEGYVFCDGTSYNRTEYAALFEAIGTTYGAVDETHFNAPDLRDCVPVGPGLSYDLGVSEDIIVLVNETGQSNTNDVRVGINYIIATGK